MRVPTRAKGVIFNTLFLFVNIAIALIVSSLIIATLIDRAHAESEAFCKNNECLKYGWTVVSNQGVADITCQLDSCADVGWNTQINGYTTQTNCHEDGCWVGGWTNLFPDNREEKIYTKNKNAMKYGWLIVPVANSTIPIREINCIAEDCEHNGLWERQNNIIYTTKCKNSDCYSSGWVTTP